MDAQNTYLTPTTYRVMRLEYLLGLAVSVYLLIVHVEDVNWLVFALFFFYTDVIGYLPGAIAFRRSSDRRISKTYYRLYNAMHSIVGAAVAVGLWALLVEPEWALLASPIHICIDRGVFGNYLKPYSTAFEPEPNPVWVEVKDRLAAPAPGEPGADVDSGAGEGVARVGAAS